MLVSALLFYAGLGWQFGNMPLLQLFIGLYFLVMLPLLIYFKCWKDFSKKSRITERMEWIVDGKWIAIKAESFETKMTWDKIYQAIELKDVFLVYQSKLQANIISKRDMSREQVQGFRAVVKGVLSLKHKLRVD